MKKLLISDEQLALEAISAREMAYTPYSHFSVGAALQTSDGSIYRGCNIENAAFGPSNCAERTAFFKAVSEGERNFVSIAIVGGREGTPISDWCAPCGVCRQVMREFCNPETFRIILACDPDVSDPAHIKSFTLSELLPVSFGPDNLE